MDLWLLSVAAAAAFSPSTMAECMDTARIATPKIWRAFPSLWVGTSSSFSYRPMAVVSSNRSSFLSFYHGGVYGRCHLSYLRRGKVSSAAFRGASSQGELRAASVASNLDPVEVNWIGTRKDAVIDFCLSSSSLSSSLSRLRFW
jgi:hypothetical protein